MKRWGLVWIVAILSCFPILLHRGTHPSMLQDSDTEFLLTTIRDRQDPLYWFTHDWPLQNHFYRPVSTLTFELDNALYGNQAWGYGITNALLCCLCVLLVAWLIRELTDSIALTLFATILFGLWNWDAMFHMAPWIRWVSVAIAFLGLFRHGFKFWRWLPAVGALWYLSYELLGIAFLRYRMVEWLPGRTASTMTVFCLVALAAYARYERVSARRTEPAPTSLDEPAGTRSSVVSKESSRFPVIWPLIAILSGALALASYEQAVMLPAALVGVGISMKLQRYQVRWAWQAGFWGLILIYYLARNAFLPDGTSGYQAQQFRNGPGVFLSIASYAIPCIRDIYFQIRVLDLGWAVLMSGQIYETFGTAYANVAAAIAVNRHWVLALTGFALSILAYLPMAWLNQFEHYHYWPMAMRSLFVAVLAWGAWELAVIAVSPPARQAPPRLSPAPGSLPRP